jgi:quercetin dioxygenase-like cupin family protein
MSQDTYPDLVRTPAAGGDSSSPEPGLTRRVLARNDLMMLVENRMETGWAGARHAHPHEQLCYILSGRFRFSCGDETFEVSAGDSFVIRGGLEHQAWALEPSVLLDVFTPPREEYLPR